ncbi:MAG: hypothetical protein J0L93_08715 [Deltaproteobacteria bacterium]|nr:hypothetical protein [Deltaproteobacteria bacterium]
MRFIYLAIAAITFSACGQNEQGVAHLFNDSQLSLNRTQTKFAESDISLTQTSTITMMNQEFESPRRIENIENSGAVNAIAPQETLEQISLKKAAELFPGYEMKLLHLRKGSRFTYATFQQTFKGKEVVGAKMILRLKANGEWKTSSTTLVNPKFFSTVKLNPSAGLSSSKFFPAAHHVIRQQSVLYPKKLNESDFQVFAAREFVLYSTEQQMEFWIWADENTGEAIGAYNPASGARQLQVVGTVLPNAPGDELFMVAFPELTATFGDKEKIAADGTGNFRFDSNSENKGFKVTLENPFLSVFNNAKPDTAYAVQDISKFPGDKIVLDGGDQEVGPSLEDRNIYYWVMQARKFLHEKLNFDKMDYQLVAFANYGEKFDNAFFMPLMKTLSFGAGSMYFKNTALSRDVVIHEFGHAVTFEIYGNQPGYEFGAMNEAFSDYLAATITDNPDIGENSILPALMERRGGHPYLRTVENKLVFPKDFLGTAFHDDGQMFGGALWNLRKTLGADVADKLIHEARLAQAKSIQEFIRELLIVDKGNDSNPYTPSKNERAIWNAFRSHGLNSTTRFDEKNPDLTTPWRRKPQAVGCLDHL